MKIKPNIINLNRKVLEKVNFQYYMNSTIISTKKNQNKNYILKKNWT